MQEDFENKQLLLQIKKGNEKAFAEAYNQYHQAVFANIYKLVADQYQAQDILQEVFIALWNNKQKLSSEHSLAGWLFTASYYKSIAYIKKCIKQSLIPFSPELHDILIDNNIEYTFETDYIQKLSVLDAAIELLPPQKKLAFKLRRLEGKTYDEIAVTLNISAESARDYVKSASKLLKRQISVTPLIGSYFLLFFLQV